MKRREIYKVRAIAIEGTEKRVGVEVPVYLPISMTGIMNRKTIRTGYLKRGQVVKMGAITIIRIGVKVPIQVPVTGSTFASIRHSEVEHLSCALDGQAFDMGVVQFWIGCSVEIADRLWGEHRVRIWKFKIAILKVARHGFGFDCHRIILILRVQVQRRPRS